MTLREEGSDPWSPQWFTQNSSVPSQLVDEEYELAWMEQDLYIEHLLCARHFNTLP